MQNCLSLYYMYISYTCTYNATHNTTYITRPYNARADRWTDRPSLALMTVEKTPLPQSTSVTV